MNENWLPRLVKAKARRYDRWGVTKYRAGAKWYRLVTGLAYGEFFEQARCDFRAQGHKLRVCNRRKVTDSQARGRWFLFRARKTGKLDNRLLFQNHTMWESVS